MEGNRDEALRALEIAAEAEKNGDFPKALKLYQRSYNLYPTEKAKFKITHLKDKPSAAQNTRNASPPRTTRSRPAATEETKREFTPDQKKLVDRINACKDYYEMLEVSKDADKDEISKKYKKLALRLHPDKNGAPGAEDAFKKVSQAFSVLNDASKRNQYNHRGFDAESSDAPTYQRRNAGNGYGNMDGMSAEELFQAFFQSNPGNFHFSMGPNMNYQFGQPQRRRAHQHVRPENQEPQGLFSTIVQFIPILLVLFFVLLSGGRSTESAYSLNKTGYYQYQLASTRNAVPYFVRSDFESSYPARSRSRYSLEEEIETHWYRETREKCRSEKVLKRRAQEAAEYYDDDVERSRARNMKMPSCAELDKRDLSH
ncbi:DnaJ (Hsp40) protein, subfamily B, member 12 [Planoprotostelium fungivorum]|uniref:DnaJ (Hsp40) protein, subfamily B, member 12 n=1 Tax=Planoprotostelium fungivorum TaxID=1890364 RepID=A0A2P6NL77_9EUKA|nr:DnaJ (Hsp40) protein, subfamily B, member 12 [Planoprotostelium fungivorum]